MDLGDIGDIIYYGIAVFLLVLGFFNKSQKEKNAKKELAPQPKAKPNAPDAHRREKQLLPNPKPFKKRNLPPPVLQKTATEYKKREFESSLNFITDFNKESSIGGSLFVNDEGMRAIFSEEKTEKETTHIHPLVADLLENDTTEELKKAIVYSEIFQRKY